MNNSEPTDKITSSIYYLGLVLAHLINDGTCTDYVNWLSRSICLLESAKKEHQK